MDFPWFALQLARARPCSGFTAKFYKATRLPLSTFLLPKSQQKEDTNKQTQFTLKKVANFVR